MSRYVAFLGGINVGGHRISMEALRCEFEALCFTEVSTFIASGNVLFEATGAASKLESTIEAHLADRLGYAVPTFVRSRRAVIVAVGLVPFGVVKPRYTHIITFLRKAPSSAARRETEALSNRQDRLEVHGKELHWLIDGGVSDSSIKPAVLAKAIGQPFTSRNVKSLRKLAASFT
jgi:uncharacterized protein (DUF1697 family)